MLSVTERHIKLEGAKNFRDLGGYGSRCGRQVKSGRLFRSASLAELTDNDLDTINALGIRAVCDLRRDSERHHEPSRWIQGSQTKFHHIPFLLDESGGRTIQLAMEMRNAGASREMMINLYRNMVLDQHSLSQIKRLFDLLAADEMPLLVHCSGGKDRTGLACALILALLNVESDLIFEDYMLSLELFSKAIEINLQAVGQIYDLQGEDDLDVESLQPIYTVEPDYLQSSFDTIAEQYGSLEKFFSEGLLLSQRQIDQIQKQLLD